MDIFLTKNTFAECIVRLSKYTQSFVVIIFLQKNVWCAKNLLEAVVPARGVAALLAQHQALAEVGHHADVGQAHLHGNLEGEKSNIAKRHSERISC